MGADRARVEVPSHAFSHGTHRVVDPGDPPRELSGWAWGIYVILGLLAILTLLRFFAALGLHSSVTGGGDIVGDYHDYSRWVAIDGVVFLVAAGVFITWFFQAYKNLRRLGVGNMRFGNGWAIGAWFVPILSLFRPKQIANDIWRGSERGAEVSSGWKAVPVPSLVHWWWGLFLTQGGLVYFGQQSTEDGYKKLSMFGELSEGFSQIKSGTTVEVIGDVVGLAAVVLAIMVVARITERLDQIREETIAQVPSAPYYPQAPPTAQAPTYPPPPQHHQSYPPPPPAPQYAQPQQPAQPPPPPVAEQRIQCPDCAEWIQAQANVCRFCGHRLRPLGQ